MSNLSVITTQAQDLAFMGGYLTTLIAEDWRSSGLIPNDTGLGLDYKDAFENGARYLCGLCVPYWAPLLYFPVVVEATASGTGLMPGTSNEFVIIQCRVIPFS
jgi:hypothetical protein